MSSDPFRDLALAYQHLTRRPPRWISHPRLSCYGGLDGIVAAIRGDHPDSTESDAILRTLAEIGGEDGRATTVALYSLVPEVARRISRATTSEFRADALSELAAVILEPDDGRSQLAHRYVNRAHNRVHKHHHRVRNRGKAVPFTVHPLPNDRLLDYRDRQADQADIAELVAARVDLERFGTGIVTALAEGTLEPRTWATFSDLRLRVVYMADRQPIPTRERVAAWRASKKVQPLIDAHLQGHAA